MVASSAAMTNARALFYTMLTCSGYARYGDSLPSIYPWIKGLLQRSPTICSFLCLPFHFRCLCVWFSSRSSMHWQIRLHVCICLTGAVRQCRPCKNPRRQSGCALQDETDVIGCQKAAHGSPLLLPSHFSRDSQSSSFAFCMLMISCVWIPRAWSHPKPTWINRPVGSQLIPNLSWWWDNDGRMSFAACWSDG